MPPTDLEKLTRIVPYEEEDMVVLRPGIALVMYSRAEMSAVMRAAADVLESYLDFVPSGAIAAVFDSPLDENEPAGFVPFDASARRKVLDQLRAGPTAPDVEGDGLELVATPNAQAGDYGVTISALNFPALPVDDGNTSLIRLEWPWNLFDRLDVETLVDYIERAAGMFPYCCGNAGMSFLYTIGCATAAHEELPKLLPRFLGFDSSYNTAQLRMRGKSPPAHWLNLLDGDLVAALGGEEALRYQLAGCEVRNIGGGLLIRAAKFPPVVDVNRKGRDIGLLPVVARALRPVRFDRASFAGFPDEEDGQAWLERFDDLDSGDWDNG
jgi:hypothetical protein